MEVLLETIHRNLIAFGPLLLNALLAPILYKLILKFRIVQTVSQHLGESHQKKQGTPTMGGLLILPGLLLLAGGDSRALVTVLSFAVIGFLDDFVIPKWMPTKRGLGWIPKLGLQLFACYLVLVSTGIFQSSGVSSAQLQSHIAFGLFCILVFANAYNLADGLDALAGGLMFFIALGLAGLWLVHGMFFPWVFIGLALCVLPFLWFNKPPAKVFMGDVGSLPLGALLGYWIGFRSWSQLDQPSFTLPLLLICLVLIIELIPVPLQILWVKLFGKRLFLRTPIHHAFEHMGWPESRILRLFLGTQAALSALAVVLALQMTLGAPG